MSVLIPLAFQQQISSVCRICYLELCRISAIRHYLSEDVTKKLLCAFVLSRLDYCNSLLTGWPKYLLSKCQKVQNNAARLTFRTTRSAHVTLMFVLFTSYLLSRGSNTSCLCFALRSLLIMSPSTFQSVLTCILLSNSSALLQTPERQNSILYQIVQWSASLFLLPGSSYLEPTPCFCPSFYLCHFFQTFFF